MHYTIEHQTTYSYESSVSLSLSKACMIPRDTENQTCLDVDFWIEPQPSFLHRHADYFGNQTICFGVQDLHRELVVKATSKVEVRKPTPVSCENSVSWEKIQAQVAKPDSDQAWLASEFSFATVLGNTSDELKALAESVFTPGRPVLVAARELCHKINQSFTYKKGATSTTTTATDVLAGKKGVCQDFAHLYIGACRCLGLPVRYVSGYLETHPPKGKPKLVGVDESHAWIAIWAGEAGWVDFDPTNDLMQPDRHVTVGWGRDYQDLPPLRGVSQGGGPHTIKVSVDLQPDC